MKLYNLTHNGNQYVSELPPSILPDSKYSFVEITYTNELVDIKTTYFDDYLSEITLQQLDINNMTDKLDDFISTLSEEKKEEIYKSVKFIALPDQEEDSIEKKIEKIFILGLSSTLTYFYFMTTPIIDKIFDIHFKFPFSINLSLIDNNIWNYLNYISKLSIKLHSPNLGKFWFIQIENFFNQFNTILPSIYIINPPLITDIAHNAMQGYANYVYEEIIKAIELFNIAEYSTKEGLDKLNKEVDNMYDEVKEYKKRLFTDIDKRQESMKEFFTEDLKKLLYAEIPEITNRVEYSLDLKLYKILTKKIEECFSEVLLDYKETAAYRLRDVLEPVVYEAINKFKSTAQVSQIFLENSVIECRKYGSMCKEITKNTDELQKDFYKFNVDLIEKNKELKNEIKYLRDEIYSVNKLVEKICRSNNLKI